MTKTYTEEFKQDAVYLVETSGQRPAGEVENGPRADLAL